jgi:MoaA/NifB/PqqE/SkfB family radical SAM enzyme
MMVDANKMISELFNSSFDIPKPLLEEFAKEPMAIVENSRYVDFLAGCEPDDIWPDYVWDPKKRYNKSFLQSIGLILSYKCPVRCSHCISNSGPDRKEEVPLEDAFDWIQQIAKYRNGHIKTLCLTGGEPFYDIGRLEKVVKFAKDCGLEVSVVTNCFWADTLTKAVDILNKLPIKMLAISADVYHQKFIPLERVKNAILAAQKLKIPYRVQMCTENEDDVEYKRMYKKLLEITEENRIKTSIILPAGRAADEIDMSKFQISNEPANRACFGLHPIICPEGEIIACAARSIELSPSHPFFLGNLYENSLEEILDRAEINPILHVVRIWGPQKFISLAKEAGLEQYIPKEYIKNNMCHTCYTLMYNPKIAKYFAHLTNDERFITKIAYARAYYLGETTALELLHRPNLKY